MHGAHQFLNEVKLEFEKIIWPKQRELIGSIIIVLLLVIFFSLFLGTIDFCLYSLAQRIY